ncbi:hypothetical protein BGZ58_006750 [Dissophora ornata]|nr:hypothetical protein BGZ58_006750 [Dissophora ornata]
MILDAPSEQDASSERSEGSDSETELESATLINSNSPPPAEVPPRTKKAKKRERLQKALDGKSSNRSLAIIRHDFEASGTPANILGMLRIHLDFPRVQGITPVTCVKTEIAANGTIVENVMVYINLSNMDDFFVVVEGIKESKEEMRDLKKLVRYIAAN